MVAATRSGAARKTKRTSVAGAARQNTVTLSARTEAKKKAGLPPSSPSDSHPRPDPSLAERQNLESSLVLPVLYDHLGRLKSANSTICPSQVARKLHELHPARFPDWRALMDPVRDIVWDEVAVGKVEVTQGGIPRGLDERAGLKGPIRVRRGKEFTAEASAEG